MADQTTKAAENIERAADTVHTTTGHVAEAASPGIEQVMAWVMDHVYDNHDYVAAGPMKLFDLDGKGGIPVTLHLVNLFIGIVIIWWLFVKKFEKDPNKAPSGFTNLLESMVLFVRDEICIPYLGKKDGRALAPWFLNFFFFILILNLMGLVPIFGSVTGNLMFTLALATVSMFFMTIYAIYKNGPVGWFKAFVPSGVPLPILFMVVPLELLGVFIKNFVLALRLFANLFAGHLVLFTVMALLVVYGKAALPAFLMLIFVYLLEIFIAFLQAFIFAMLAALFTAQILHPDH